MQYLSKRFSRICHVSFVLFFVLWIAPYESARADQQSVTIPRFWGAEERLQKPDLLGTRVVRFLTDDEYPPLHFSGFEGQPAGFSVDLARAACALLEWNCTIQVRRFDTLLEALRERRGDVIAAAVPIQPSLYERFTVTRPYHRMPARFVRLKDEQMEKENAFKREEVMSALLKGRKVAVVKDTAHEAYLKNFFPEAERVAQKTLADAQQTLQKREVDYLFADGMSLSFWLNGAAAEGCCVFASGPYLESHYFGEGIGFIVRNDDKALRDALNYALHKMEENGTYAEIYLRYFPLSFY